jgi:hypothetical protein
MKKSSLHRRTHFLLIGVVGFFPFFGLSQNKDTKINVQQDIHLNAQASATVEGPAVVKAGEEARFSVTLDRPPNFDNGGVYYEFRTGDEGTFSSSFSVDRSHTTYTFGVVVPIDSPAETWVLKKLIFVAGNSIRQPLTMSHTITFKVLPVSGLRFPTSADVSINLSQVQLLRMEASKLQRQLQDLKVRLSSPKKSDLTGILGRTVRDALEALNATEASFRKLATTGDADLPAAKVFFDDLRLSYHDAASTVRQSASMAKGQVLRVSQDEIARGNYPPAAYAVLRSFEQNELAYTVVADTQSLVFNLDVQSVPTGATVCYHRRNDPCHPHPNQTNSTIPSLPYAIWVVHFEKRGYNAEDREHDPFREPNHIVVVELKK